MESLGLNSVYKVEASNRPGAPLGNHIAACYIRFGFLDGANEKNGYENTVYKQVGTTRRDKDVTWLALVVLVCQTVRFQHLCGFNVSTALFRLTPGTSYPADQPAFEA